MKRLLALVAFAAFAPPLRAQNWEDTLRVSMSAFTPSEKTPAESIALIKTKLAGSGLPDAYVDGVFADARAKIYPDIPPKFGTPTSPVPPTPYDQYRKYFVT